MKFYKYGEDKGLKLQFTVNTKLCGVPEVAVANLKRFAVSSPTCAEICNIFVKPINDNIADYAESKSGEAFKKHQDGFVIRTEDNDVVVYADDQSAAIYGLMTFLRLLDEDACFNYRYIWDYPNSSFRGVKIYLPAREEMDDYKALVNMMMYFRHNTIMMEVGGAMELKRHPEINEGWVEYCEFMTEYPEKAMEIQDHTFPWRKDCIHAQIAGGKVLSQDEVREIIKYATDRGLEVIPEIPSTSHCDYLLTRHPELAERPEDPYPDTFCPSNPASYELLFDVFDEVIEVFNPRIINVGHDEYYSINVCDRCRKRIMDAADIFAEDLTKIHDYLESKGVKTMFWCDKILNVLSEDGINFGGAINYVYMNWKPWNKFLGIIPATWEARFKIPKDIICMNWMWEFGEEHDEALREFPVVFGNFRGENFLGGYRKRCGSNTTGGMCSNWAATTPMLLQRNRIYFSMAYHDQLFWNNEYDDTNDAHYEEVCNKVFEELFTWNYGLPINREDKYIEVVHTTDKPEFYIEFAEGIYVIGGDKYEKDYHVGDYRIEYTDGTVQTAPIYQGEHIANQDIKWYGAEISGNEQVNYPGSGGGRMDNRVAEIAYSTFPLYIGEKFYCRYLIKKANPEKQIKNIEFLLIDGADWKVDVKEIKY